MPLHNLLAFYGNKSIVAHPSTLHNDKTIKTPITQNYQVKKHRSTHVLGKKLDNHHRHICECFNNALH